MSILRWIVTAAALALVGLTGLGSARRLTAEILRIRADGQYASGDMLAALDTYDRALAWNPLAPVAHTDPADTAAYALSYRVRPLPEQPELAPALALRGVTHFYQSAATAPPAPWSWAGMARIYEDLRVFRPRIEPTDLSRLGADPLENLQPEDLLAEAALLQALRYEPSNYFFLDSLGELYWRRGLKERALAPFRQAVSIHPILDRHYYVRERASQSDDLAAAIQEGLRSALVSVPLREHWVVQREMGHLARLRGREEEALRHYRQAIDLVFSASERELAALYFYLAESQRMAGMESEAVTSLRSAIHVEPGRAHFHGSLGVLLGRLGRHQEALLSLGAARALDPAEPRLARLMAEQCRQVGDLDRAERAYQDLIRLQPDHVDPYLQVIEMFRAVGAFARAIPYARELARLHPDEAVYGRQLDQLYEEEVRR